MKQLFLLLVNLLFIFDVVNSVALDKANESSEQRFVYPKVRRNETVVDEYHGTKIADPYRWLEDPDTDETKQFVEAQNNLTFSYIEKAESRDKIREKLTKLWNYPKQGLPKKRGDAYYLYKNSGIQNQWVMYTAASLEKLDKDAKVFLDPNTFSSDGTIALSKISFSKNGALVVYTLSQSGSDWSDIHIRNASTGQDFPEILTFTKFTSIAWTHDNLGFFYTRYPSKQDATKNTKSNTDEAIYYHRVGTNQSADTLMVSFPDHPAWSLGMDVSDEGDYLLISAYEVINEEYLFYAKISEAIKTGLKEKLTPIPLVTKPASYSNVANDGPIFYFITNEGAPKYRFIAMDINNPDKAHWATLIPEHPTDVLSWASAIDNDKVMTSYSKDVKSTLELRNLRNGTLIKEFPLEAGSIQSTEGRREDSLFYFKIATFSNPGVSYGIDLNKSAPFELELYQKVNLPNVDTNLFETKQVFYKSKDGTQVPMFITHRKDLVLNGDAPTLLYGYGGFSSNTDPFFSVGYLTFINGFNGILAIPNIRGGGEYGTKWWDDGRLLNKQNVFDDFAAAAEYLIENKYTSSSKLTIQGASNGGLLVGSCVNQRPELYGAAIAEVGVMDMLRFQKFTVGSFWCGEYGCSENKTHFENLIKYSPLHNIRVPENGVQYPAVFVNTADHDDRVVPSHSFKYISELQYTVGQSKQQKNPLMIRIEKKAGHGHGKPTAKQIEEYVDQFSFLVQSLGLKFEDN